MSSTTNQVTLSDALRIARENQHGEFDPARTAVTGQTIDKICRRVEEEPSTYIFTSEEFTVFNYYRDAFKNNEVAQQAVRRFWERYKERFSGTQRQIASKDTDDITPKPLLVQRTCRNCRLSRTECDGKGKACHRCKLHRIRCLYEDGNSQRQIVSKDTDDINPKPLLVNESDSKTSQSYGDAVPLWNLSKMDTPRQQGCQPCRASQRECDESRPVCYECGMRHVRCFYGYANPRDIMLARNVKQKQKLETSHQHTANVDKGLETRNQRVADPQKEIETQKRIEMGYGKKNRPTPTDIMLARRKKELEKRNETQNRIEMENETYLGGPKESQTERKQVAGSWIRPVMGQDEPVPQAWEINSTRQELHETLSSSLSRFGGYVLEGEEYDLVNSMKLWVQRLTGESWDWWPFRPSFRPLLQDEIRIQWHCVSY